MKRPDHITLVKHVTKKRKKREHWKSKAGFLFAAIGSAVGLGNIWRFSYVAGENGGGGFLIPYIISVIFLGIPLVMMEFAAGSRFKESVICTFKKINCKLKGAGYFVVFTSFLILTYYCVIAGWTIAYFLLFMLKKQIPFAEFTQTNLSIYFFVAVILIALWILSKGIRKGIERTCKILIPLLFVCLIVLIIRAVTLPGAGEGISYYLTPNFSYLTNPATWLAAFGQAFFSLSAGFGVYLTYASYGSSKENIPGSTVIIAFADSLIAFLAGIMIFSLVFSFGIDPSSGPTLAFVALPKVFSEIFLGNIFAVIFFLLLFVAALSSIISMMEVIISSIVDEFEFSRKKVICFVGGAVILFGIPSALSYSGYDVTIAGKPFLDFADMIVGNYFIPLSCAILAIAIGWIWSSKELMKEINSHAHPKIPKFFIYFSKIVIPIVLVLFVIITFLTQTNFM